VNFGHPLELDKERDSAGHARHRREKSMTATLDTETRRIRAQAQAERRVESCERPSAKYTSEVEEEDQYAIIKSKKPVAVYQQDEPDDEVSLFMKTAQSPDVQTLKRRLIDHANSRQTRG
jgi:hypothetical protein